LNALRKSEKVSPKKAKKASHPYKRRLTFSIKF